jgi:hypothetical protein
MKRLGIIICLILALAIATSAFAQAKRVILWRWVDEAGKIHFTGNFNAIPSTYRNRAAQGVFLPDKPLVSGNPGTHVTKKPDRPKVTNKLEIFEEKYFEKDDNLVVTGRVRNGFAQPISNVKIKVTFLDEEDNFLRTESTFITPILIRPGDEGTFQIEVPFTQDIAGYRRDIEME